MDPQTIFYWLAIVWMVLMILTLLGIALVVWKIYAMVAKTKKRIDEATQEIKDKLHATVSMKKTELASAVIKSVSSEVVKRIKKKFSKDK